jgi:hypothetical protein
VICRCHPRIVNMHELGLRDKDIELAAVVEGGAWIEKETTSLGGSARVRGWLRGWHHGGRGVPSPPAIVLACGCGGAIAFNTVVACIVIMPVPVIVAVTFSAVWLFRSKYKNGRHIETMRQAYQKEHPLRRRPPTRFQKGWLQVDPQVSLSVAFPHSWRILCPTYPRVIPNTVGGVPTSTSRVWLVPFPGRTSSWPSVSRLVTCFIFRLRLMTRILASGQMTHHCMTNT